MPKRAGAGEAVFPNRQDLQHHQYTRRHLVLTDQGLAVAVRWLFIVLEVA